MTDRERPPTPPIYVEAYVAEDDVTGRRARRRERARLRADRPRAVAPALRFLAAAIAARAVVEIGTGTGVSGLWLLRGMRPDGVLTSIDVDPEHQRVARAALHRRRARAVPAAADQRMGLEVLPRLTDGGYDLVFVDAEPGRVPALPRRGACGCCAPAGWSCCTACSGAGVLDPDAADASTLALREVARQVRDDERLVPMLLPLGDGLLAAVRARLSLRAVMPLPEHDHAALADGVAGPVGREVDADQRAVGDHHVLVQDRAAHHRAAAHAHPGQHDRVGHLGARPRSARSG